MSAAEARARRPSVAIVDDDVELAIGLSLLLRDRYEVLATAASDVCGRLALGERFSIILLDLLMPGMNGVELYEWMLGACPEQSERVIFMTAGATVPYMRRFQERMGRRLLMKPFDPSQLEARIEEVLQGD